MADAVAERPVEKARQAKISLRKSRLLPEFPYPGLRPFRKDEWPIFCGRREIVDQLLSALGATQFVPVLGTSGCGKSSIIKAGLISTLEREHAALGSAWRATEMRPENAPMWNLAEALWRATHGDQPGSPAELSQMRAKLGRAPGGIERVLNEYGFPNDLNLLILVDQFEELFRFGVPDEEIQLFTDQLIDVFDARPRGIHITLTMRADFLADCARWPRLADALNRTAYLLRWLTEAEMREAITTPARLYRGTVDADLVDRMIADVGGKQDQLPIVQHALMWMWNRIADSADPGHLTLADYEGPEVRGVEGALSLHADKIYDGLAKAQLTPNSALRDLRPATRLLLQALSAVDASNRVIRRPCSFGQLRAITGCAADELQYIIDQFRKPGTSFLVTDDVPQLQDTDTVDVSHEALIRQWSKMQGRGSDEGWLAEERRDAENWRSLESEVRKFRKAKKGGRERYLSGDQNDDLQAWWKQRAPSAGWAARYSPDARDLFPAVEELLQISAKRARRARLQRLALIAAPAVVILGMLFTYAGLQRQALDQAIARQDELEKNAKIAQNQLTASMAHQAAEGWRATEALVLTQHLLESGSTPIAEGIGYRALTRQHMLRQWSKPAASDWTPDGRSIALALRGNKVQILDTDNVNMDPQTVTFADFNEVYNVAIAPNGDGLAASDGDGTRIEYWSQATSKRTGFDTDGVVDNLWFTPNGRWIVASSTTEVIVIDTTKDAEIIHLPGVVVAYSPAISSDNAFMALITADGHLSILPFEEGAKPVYDTKLSEPAGEPTIDGQRGLVAVPLLDDAATDAIDPKVALIDFKNRTRRDIPYSAEAAPTSVRFSSKGKMLAVGSEDGSLRKIDVDTLIGPKAALRQILNTPGDLLPSTDNKASVVLLRFSPDGDSLLQLGSDHTGLVIDLKTNATFPIAPTWFGGFVGDGSELITLDDDDALRLWHIEAEIEPERFGAMSSWGLSGSTTRSSRSAPPASQVLGLLYQDDQPIVVAKLGSHITFYESGDEKALPLFDNLGESEVVGVSREKLAYVDSQGAVTIQGIGGAAQKIGVSKLKEARLFFDGDKRALLVSLEDSSGKLALQEIATPGTPALPTLADGNKVLALSPRSVLLTNIKTGAISLVPTEAGAGKSVELPLADPNSAVRAAALSADDQFAAVLQDNGTVSVWDKQRAALVALFGEPSQKLSTIAFPPRGGAIDALSTDGTVYRWGLFFSSEDLARAIERATPNLRKEEKEWIIDSARANTAAPQ